MLYVFKLMLISFTYQNPADWIL